MKPSDWLGDVYCWENELLILCICFKPLIKGTKKGLITDTLVLNLHI